MPIYYETILNPVSKTGVRYSMKTVTEGKVRTANEVIDLACSLMPHIPRAHIAEMFESGILKTFNAYAEKGESFDTSFLKARFSLHGDKSGPEDNFVRGTDSIELHFNPAAETRELADKAPVEKVAMPSTGPVIGGVFDETLKEENGRIMRGGYIRINGRGIEIVGPQATIEFVSTLYNVITPADLSTLLLNKPSELFIRVPLTTAPGINYIRITTHYSSAHELLKIPRTVTFHLPLTVVAPASSVEE
jgi:hypothetical protein